MNHSARRSRVGAPTTDYRLPRRCVVCVVDARPQDYLDWASQATAAGVELLFAGTAAEALRLRNNSPIDLWVVNDSLPGLSGCELCQMLRSQATRTPVYLVSDEYSPTAEQAALAARATLYGCKGSHRTWLGDWLRNRVRHEALTAA